MERIFFIGVKQMYLYSRTQYLLIAGDDDIGDVANHKIWHQNIMTLIGLELAVFIWK